MRALICLTVVVLVLSGCGGSPQTTGGAATPKSSAPKSGGTAEADLSLTFTLAGTNETFTARPSATLSKVIGKEDYTILLFARTEGITATVYLTLGNTPKLAPGDYQRPEKFSEVILERPHPDKAKAQEGIQLACTLQGTITVTAVRPDRTFDGSFTASHPQGCGMGTRGKMLTAEESRLGQVSVTGKFKNVRLPKNVN